MTVRTVEPQSNPIYEAAERYAAMGVSVIPIAAGTKEPPERFRWGQYADRIADASERYHWFVECGHQLGVIGNGSLVPLDFDSPTGFESMAEQYPELRTLPRIRTGSGKHHVWIQPAEPTAYYQARTPDGGILEVRAGVHYTVAPPSIHPDTGQPYIWEIEPGPEGIPVVPLESIGLRTQRPRDVDPGEPIDTDGTPLTEAEFDHLVRILEPHWVPNSRHAICLYLSGWLAQKRVPQSDTLHVIQTLAEMHGDENRIREFRRAIRDTYHKVGQGIAVGGWSKLTDHGVALVSASAATELDFLMRQRDPKFIILPPSEATDEHPYVISVADLLREPDEPEVWLVDGLVRDQSLGLTVGPPKTFKSFFEQEVQLAIASGTPAFGQFAVQEPQVCVYVQEESNRNAWRRRWRQMLKGKGIHPSAIEDTLYTVTNQGLELDNRESMTRFIDWVMKEYEPAYITLDPLREMHSLDENSSQDMRPILKLLKQLRDEYQVTIQLVHHNNKNPNYETPFDSIRGSTAIWGAMDAGVFVMRTENESVMQVRPMLKEGGQVEPFLYSVNERDGALVLDIYDVETNGKFQPHEIVSWAKRRGDWWPIEHAITDLPAGQTTLRTAVRKLVSEGHLKERQAGGRRKLYAYPEVDDDEPTF